MSEFVPDGWEITTISEIVKNDSLFSDGDWVESKDQDQTGINRLIQLADIGDGIFINKSSRFMNDEQFTRLRCTEMQEGDVLIARMPEPLGRACILPKLPQKCATVVDVAIIRTTSANHYWLMSVINSSEFRSKIELNASGTTRTRIGRVALSHINLLKPPLPEQKKIASILTSVDEVIEKTEAQISKLQDLKKGMMQELLTKGIGHTEFKDSPVGRIPKSWELKSLSDCCSKMTNGFVGATRDIYVDKGIPYVLCQNIRPNLFVNKIFKYVGEKFHQKNIRAELKEGDVLTVQTGAGNGDTCVVPKAFEGANCHALIISRPKKDILNSYYYSEYMNSDVGKNRISVIATGGAHPHVNTTDLRNEVIPLPSIEEQNEIASILNSIVDNIMEVKKENQKYKDVKKALMQDLLTGKVRVNVNEDCTKTLKTGGVYS